MRSWRNSAPSFYGLFKEEDAQLRGKQVEAVLNNLFEASGILIHEAFTVKGEPGEGVIEQIDGVIGLDGDLYLVEVKWLKAPVGPGDAAQHLVRVHSRAQARGILISASGYTAAVESQHRDALVRGSLVVLRGLDEIVRALEREEELAALLRAKTKAATLHRNPYHRPLD